MAEYRLKPLTALGRSAPLVERIGSVQLTERVNVALASLATRRGCEVEVQSKAAKAGFPLPEPGHAAASATWEVFWMSPDMWMVEAPYETHEDIAAQVKSVFGETASITEQTDAWVRFDVKGPLKPLFERLCNLDLDSFGRGSATRTVVEHLGVYVVHRAEGHMTVLGPRSSAASLHHAIAAAARSAF